MNVFRLLKILSSLTLALIALGSYVRATGAGLACPDWPLCFGRAVPKFEFGVAQEVLHRYLAGGVILFTVMIVYEGWKIRKSDRQLLNFSLAILTLVLVQAVFGGLTVTMKLNPYIVTTHLALGTLFFQAVATYGFAGVNLENSSGNRIGTRFKSLVLLTAIVTFLQILIGGFVGASGAALACPDFPRCGVPYNSGAQVIQIVHRILGFILALLLIICCYAAFQLEGIARSISLNPIKRVVALICLQIFVGWLNLYYGITPVITIVHILLAQGILLHLLLVWRRLGLLFDKSFVSSASTEVTRPTQLVNQELNA